MAIPKPVNFTNYIFIIVIFILISTSCQNENEQTFGKQSIIAGKIIGFNSDEDDHFIEFMFDDLLDEVIVKSIRVNKSGEFKLFIERPYAQDYFLSYGNNIAMFISPGDSLHLEIDHKILKAEEFELDPYDLIVVSGTAEKMNLDIRNYFQVIHGSLDDPSVDYKAIKDFDPMEYKAYIANKFENYHRLLEDFNIQYNTCSKFRTWANQDLEYDKYITLFSYRQIHAQMNNLKFDPKIGQYVLDIPVEYYSFLKRETVNRQAALMNGNYYRFMGYYGGYSMRTSLPNDSNAKIISIYRSGDTMGHYNMMKRQALRNTSGFSQEIVLSKLYFNISNYSISMYKEVALSNPIKDSILKELLENNIQYLASSNKRQAMRDSISTPIFDSIIEKHIGKVIYVDFWAPWCPSCMYETPYSTEIQKHYENDIIVFLYLACDCSLESWERTIEHHQIKGEHFRMTSDQFKILRSKYNIGLPHFMLIDKKGKVINLNAPRPSEETALKRAIDKLLEE